MKRALPLILALVAHGTLVWIGSRNDDPLTTDSRQYLDIARSIAEGRGVVSSIVPIDYAGTGLFPYSRHPPGFPALLALSARLGVDPRRAAVVLPLLGSLASLVLLYVLARRSCPGGGALAALFYGLGYPFAETANHALTEPLFLASVLAALLLAERVLERPGAARARTAFVAGACGAIPVALRYSGVAVLALLAALIFLRAAAGPPESRAHARRLLVAWCAGAAAVAGPLAIVLARVGAPTDLPSPFFGFPFNLFWCARFTGKDLFVPFPEVPAGPVLGVLGALALLAGPALLLSRRGPRVGTDSPRAGAAVDSTLVPRFAALYPLCHAVLLAWAGTKAFINGWPTRHLLPTYPFLFLTLMILSGRARRFRVPLLGAFLAVYGVGNALLAEADRRSPSPPMDLGSIPLWIEAHTSPGESIVTMEAEVFADAIPGRRWLSLVRFPYSRRALDPADLDRLSAVHGARYLILLDQRMPEIQAGFYGPFLKGAAREGAGPGLRLVARVPGGLVFETADASARQSPAGRDSTR